MARLSTLRRALQLLRLMEGRRWRPTGLEVAAVLGCTERNARRWLAACHEAGVPMAPTVHEKAGGKVA